MVAGKKAREGQTGVTLFPKLMFHTVAQHCPEGYLTLPSCLSSGGNYQLNRMLKTQVVKIRGKVNIKVSFVKA